MYREPIKDRSRRLIWSGAVELLTGSRATSRVITDRFMADAGAYLARRRPNELGKRSGFSTVLRDWRRYADMEYGKRRPEELKVAYLCGPNPRNDLQQMVKLGIAVHNVWAIESERDASRQALEEARELFPELKIVPFKAQRFFEAPPVTFDIVYLDFTAPLLSTEKKPYEALHMLFDAQALADLSVVVVNSAYPDDTAENRAFLASFLAAMPWTPAALTKDQLKRDAGDKVFERYTDGGDVAPGKYPGHE